MASQIVDNLIAYKILTMLVKPFIETDAFKLGIIDKNGKNLIPTNKLQTTEQKESYNYLYRLVFNMKKLINKLPGGDNKIKNMIAALYLVKEQYKLNTTDTINEEEFYRILNLNVILAEETLLVKQLLEDGTIPVGSTGPTNVSMPSDGSPSKVSTDVPIKRKKTSIVKRQSFKQVAVDLNQKAL